MSHVLVVEDEPHWAKLLKQCLVSVSPDATIDIARDGEAAMDRLRSQRTSHHGFLPYDLIVLDLALPRQAGTPKEDLSSARAILLLLRQDFHSSVPIVVFSTWIDIRSPLALQAENMLRALREQFGVAPDEILSKQQFGESNGLRTFSTHIEKYIAPLTEARTVAERLGVIVEHPHLRQLLRSLHRLAAKSKKAKSFADVPKVTLTGPPGSGKSFWARFYTRLREEISGLPDGSLPFQPIRTATVSARGGLRAEMVVKGSRSGGFNAVDNRGALEFCSRYHGRQGFAKPGWAVDYVRSGVVVFEDIQQGIPELLYELRDVVDTGEVIPIAAQAPIQIGCSIFTTCNVPPERLVVSSAGEHSRGSIPADVFRRFAQYQCRVPALWELGARFAEETMRVLFRQQMGIDCSHITGPARDWLGDLLATRAMNFGELAECVRRYCDGNRGTDKITDAIFHSASLLTYDPEAGRTAAPPALGQDAVATGRTSADKCARASHLPVRYAGHGLHEDGREDHRRRFDILEYVLAAGGNLSEGSVFFSSAGSKKYLSNWLRSDPAQETWAATPGAVRIWPSVHGYLGGRERYENTERNSSSDGKDHNGEVER